MAGLACALTLAARGVRSTVFDTGKHGLGGRMATRHVVADAGGHELVFDHAAQYFTASDPAFLALVDAWVSQGLVDEWTGLVARLSPGGAAAPLPPSRRYVGRGGMRALCDGMLADEELVAVERPTWVSHMRPHAGGWALSDGDIRLGDFDAVVVAHNGDRRPSRACLCGNGSVPQLFFIAGADTILPQARRQRLKLSSIWSLMAAFDGQLPVPEGLEGAHVDGVPAVAWLGNNTAKLALGDRPQCWTMLSTKEYGLKNKVPQEAVPRVRAARVTKEMLAGLAAALGVDGGAAGLPSPIYTRVQLWGAALPLNSPGTPCIFDAVGRVGICGDWLLSSTVEAAALSGIALDFRDAQEEDLVLFSVGLEAPLADLRNEDIGTTEFLTASPATQYREPAVAMCEEVVSSH
eukprot:SM000015S01310  [mRNA]  locus=s15:1204096:1206459:- [translate_table: standard]